MTRYKCPKCKMEYDAPGKCDICNVTLEKIEEKGIVICMEKN